MIPCAPTEILRWNALDDLDDDISDRVNDDLIPQDHDEDLYKYDDPDLLTGSFMSYDSTVDSSDESYDSEESNGRDSDRKALLKSAGRRGTNMSRDSSSHIDEDGLILALDDSTNRQMARHSSNQGLSKTTNSNSNDVVTVRVKKSVKYGSRNSNSSNNENENHKGTIIRPIPSNSRGPSIETIYSDGTMNSMSPTGDENYVPARNPSSNSSDNIVTVRVKKSVKYGNNKENHATSRSSVTKSRDMVATKPKINTIHSDGTISSKSPTGDDEPQQPADALSFFRKTNPKPTTTATIYSDGTIGYKNFGSHRSPNAIVQKPAQPRVATIRSDGFITYNDSDNKDKEPNNALDFVKQDPPPSKVATIHSNGFITYQDLPTNSASKSNSTDNANAMVPAKTPTILERLEAAPSPILHCTPSPTFRTSTTPGSGKKGVSFENVVTDAEDNIVIDKNPSDEDEDPDMDDDICDNLDDSRYTRSLHSMPVLEEVTEEESPLHAAGAALPPTTPSDAAPGTATATGEPTWLELRQSPSAIATMTPRRTNDEEATGDKLASRWLGILSSSKKSKGKKGRNYQSVDGTSAHQNLVLRVETCSTGSHSEHSDDLEEGGSRRCGKKQYSPHSDLYSSSSHGRKKPPQKKSCCRRRRDWVAVTIVVLIGIAMGATTFILMNKFLLQEEDQDRQQQKDRTEGLTMGEEGLGWTTADDLIIVPSGGSDTPSAISNDVAEEEDDETENEFLPTSDTAATDSEESSTNSPNKDSSSLAPSDAPTDDGAASQITSSPTISPEDTPANAFPSVTLETTVPAPTPLVQPETPTQEPLPWKDDQPSFPPGLLFPQDESSAPTDAPDAFEATQAPTPGTDRIPVIQDAAAINTVIRQARREIELLIFADDDLIGKILRLVFHDCVGGCDGCVDLTNPENVGLGKPIDALQPVAEKFEAVLSRTDVWMLASLVASELALPFESSDLTFPLHWIGRQTCESRFAETTDPVTGHCGLDFGGNPTPCSSTRGPHVPQPHATFGTASLLEFFETEFGFDAQQVTAIMGAHSVGKMARENLGFFGEWDLTTTSLDQGYWLELAGNPPDFFLEVIDNSDLVNIPNRHQWRGIIEEVPGRTVAMLNVDVALVHNIDDMDANGNVGCAGPGIWLKDCPSDTPFLKFAQDYNINSRKFLMDFRDVLNLLIDHGHPKPTPTTRCPEGRVCVFDADRTGILLEEWTAPPTAAPTREDQPRVSLDKSCYDRVGDILVVDYDFVSGTDITFEVFSADHVSSFQGRTTVDPRVAETPLKSALSCGEPPCHTWTSKGGLQIPTENLVGGGSDYVVLMFARSPTDPTGALEFLDSDSFQLEGCGV